MSESRESVSDGWLTVLQYGLFLWVFLAGSVGIGLLVISPPTVIRTGIESWFGGTGTEGGRWFVLASTYVAFGAFTILFHLATAIGLAVDALSVADADVDWDPAPWLYALGGLLLAGPTVLYYSWKRHVVIGSTATPQRWRKVAALLLVAGGLSVVLAVLVEPAWAVWQLVIVPLIAMALFQLSRSVGATNRGLANPAVSYLLTLLSGLLLVGPYIVGGYYFLDSRRDA